VSVQTELRRDDHEIAAPSVHEAAVRARSTVSKVLAGAVFSTKPCWRPSSRQMPKAEFLNHQGA
jgi:hypothetical protein